MNCSVRFDQGCSEEKGGRVVRGVREERCQGFKMWFRSQIVLLFYGCLDSALMIFCLGFVSELLIDLIGSSIPRSLFPLISGVLVSAFLPDNSGR